LAGLASPALAQITIVERETRGTETSTSQVQLDASHMRAEVLDGKERGAIVYDGPNDTTRMMNLDKKTYSEMTRAQAEQMGQQVNSAMAQMQAQLANLPPEQRAQIEQMMRGRGAGAAGALASTPQPIQYRPAGTDRVGQWSCTKYEGFRGTEKVSEVCAATPATLGLTAADFEVTRRLTGFLKSLAPSVAAHISVIGNAQEQGYVGYPVRRTNFSNGQIESVNEITEIRHGALPAGTFDVPTGFRKEAFPGAR
jgi:hypothetical protein